MVLNNFKAGQKLRIKRRWKTGIEINAAEVFCTDYNGNGLVTYIGRWGSEDKPSGSGAFDPLKVGAAPFGIVEVETL